METNFAGHNFGFKYKYFCDPKNSIFEPNLKINAMNTVKAKFNLTASLNEDGSMNVTGYPVYSSDPESENKSFSDATPCGNFQMQIAPDKEAQNLFVVGETKEYYLDISKVEA